MILRCDSAESINQELAALVEHEQGCDLPPALVPIQIRSDFGSCLTRFLQRYPTVSDVATSVIAQAHSQPAFIDWFTASVAAIRSKVPQLNDVEDVCGLALFLRCVFATAAKMHADEKLVCSLAMSLVRDERTHPSGRMQAITDTVRRTLCGDNHSEFLKTTLPFVDASETSVLLAVHLDAFGQAHDSRPFRYSCSLLPKFAQTQFSDISIRNKITISRLLKSFEQRNFIRYLDRGSNDRSRIMRRAALITLVPSPHDWPLSNAVIVAMRTLAAKLLPEQEPVHVPRKINTRKDSSNLNANDIKEGARGHWPEILQSVGLPAEQTQKRKKSECPFCGARAQWRLGDRNGDGSGICDKCSRTGLGDGFKVMQKLTGKSFRECLTIVNHFLEGIPLQRIEHRRTREHVKGSQRQVGDRSVSIAEFDDVVDEWCAIKNVRRVDLEQFGPKPGRRRVSLESGQRLDAVVFSVALYMADDDGRPLVAGYCDFGVATEKLAKGMHQAAADGVFLRQGFGFQPGQTVIAVEGIKDACALIRLGKYAVMGLPGLRVPRRAELLIGGCRGVLIPDRSAIISHLSAPENSALSFCIASLRRGAVSRPAARNAKGDALPRKWVVGNLQHDLYGDSLDDLRDVLLACRNHRELIDRLDRMENAARCGRNASGKYTKTDGRHLIES